MYNITNPVYNDLLSAKILKKSNKLQIIYFQRYNFFNHLKWFNEGKPGGHLDKNYVYRDKIIKHYSDYLCRLKKTDTIIAIAEK